MNNLKRVLSLALASVMLIGMMAVGASAADFTDEASIENKDAVGTMVALNIISGYPDGSYKPDELLLREQAAKMVFVALNGGKTSESLTTKATPTFSDIKGNWAEGYIEWAANRGILAGMGDGTFNPKGNLTGTALAKVMLVAIGYNAKTEGLEGTNDWALNVNSLALQKGFFDGLETIDPEANITRDQAALLILNACQAHMVEYSSYLNTDADGKISTTLTARDRKDNNNYVTILGEKYELKTKFAYLTNTTYNATKKQYQYTLEDGSNTSGANGTLGATIASDSYVSGNTTATIYSDEDYSDLYGQQVKILYKSGDGATDTISKRVVYGVYAVSNVLTEGVWGGATETAGKSVKVSGTTYSYDGTPAKVKFNTADAETGAPAKEFTFKVIDHDGNGKVDVIVYLPIVVSKVTYVGSSNITFTPAVEAAASLAKTTLNVYEGIAKDDYVIATPKAYTKDGKTAVVKAEVVTGTVAANRNSGADVQIDGTWYTAADTQVTGGSAPILSKEAKLVVVNGYYAFAKPSVAVSKDLLVVTRLDTADSFSGTQKAKVAFVDGTTSTVTLSEKTSANAANQVGLFYTYELDDGVYTLTLANATTTGYKALVNGGTNNVNFTAATTTATAQLSDKTQIADDAVVIVAYNASTTSGSPATADNTKTGAETALVGTDIGKLDSVKVLKGSDIKKWKTAFGKNTVTQYFYDEVNGIKYAQVLFLAADSKTLPGDQAKTSYGYITSKAYLEDNASGVTYVHFDIWTTDGKTISVMEKGNSISSANHAQGAVVRYELVSDGVVQNTTALVAGTTSNYKAGAITGYSEKDSIVTIKGTDDQNITTAVNLTDDTKYLYIKSSTKAGAEGEGVSLATENADGSVNQNAFVLDDGTSDIVLLVMDVDNKLSGTNAVGGPATTGLANADLATSGTLAVTDLTGRDAGVYTFTATSISDVSAFTGLTTSNLEKAVFIVWDSTAATGTQAYKITINNAAGTKVYEETTGTTVTAAKHVTYVNCLLQGASSAGTTYTPYLSPAGTYSYTVVGVTDGVTYGSGTFTKAATT